MTEALLLAALLSSPSWPVRDAATAALSARPAALPVLAALDRSPDPEARMRAGIAARRLDRLFANRILTGSCEWDGGWYVPWEVLEGEARRLGCLPDSYCGPTRWDRTDFARYRQLVGWCRNQTAYPPGHPMRWPWPVTWEFAGTQWKW